MNTSNITNYKPKDFAELLGISVKTLQRWDREGILKANRTPTDRRYYTYDQYLQFKGINIENDKRQAVIYARVSTKNQKDDLQNQVAFLRQFCNARGIIVDQCIEEYGSGLNYNRKKWNKLLDEVMEKIFDSDPEFIHDFDIKKVREKELLLWYQDGLFKGHCLVGSYLFWNKMKDNYFEIVDLNTGIEIDENSIFDIFMR